MLFNTSQPATLGQLDQLYLGNPNQSPEQVQSNMFMNASQGAGYINDQAARLGIGDPVEHYKKILLAQKMAQTPNGARMEAERQAGVFNPASLPGQLQARNQLWDSVMQKDQMDAGNLAALQTQNRLKAFPLPLAGVPTLSPAMQEDMRQQGISDPMDYLLKQRLGPNRSSVAAGTYGIPDADALFNEKTFQSAMLQDPRRSSDIFQALTGRDLGGYTKDYASAEDAERKRGVDFLHKSFQDQMATLGEDGTMSWRKMAPDINGKLAPTAEFGKGDAYQLAMEKYLPYTDKLLARRQALALKRGAGATSQTQSQTPVATLQNTERKYGVMSDLTNSIYGNQTRDEELAQHTETYPTMDAAQGFLAESLDDVGGLFRGRPTGEGASTGMLPASGSAVRHAAPLLRNNPSFQKLLRENPEQARRLILSIQMGRR